MEAGFTGQDAHDALMLGHAVLVAEFECFVEVVIVDVLDQSIPELTNFVCFSTR